jgi:hypothetical protein
MSTHILALDLATTTGFCIGAPGEMPRCGSVRFGNSETSADAVFAHGLKWFSEFLRPEPRPSSIILEAMLPLTAMKGETSTATRDRLAGLHGVVRAVAHLRGIYEISEVGVLVVRKHFCGSRGCGKHAVYEKCRALHYPVHDLDAADACATWHFACSLIKPEIALEVSPLFGKRPMRISV